MNEKIMVVLALAIACQSGEAREVAFSSSPKVTKHADGARIAFATSAPTDCAVYILDRSGKVVRHLAAGVLGDEPPSPLKPGLAQSLIWDGNDDFGNRATDAPFSARVCLGLEPTFDRLIGFNSATLGSVRALATGPQGELYVFHVFGSLHPSDGTVACSVFDRQGRYLRTIMPYPANLPDERLQGIKRVELNNGVTAPFIYQGETRSLIPGAGDLPAQRPVVTKDGRLAFVGIQEWAAGALRYAQAGVAQVVVINTDGSVPRDGVLKTLVADRSSSAASLALSPDEKTLYASGLRKGNYAGKPTHAVYRFGWSDESTAVLVGVENEAGSDESHLNDPRGIAVDKAGNVYVADKGNDRVVIFKPDGAFVGAFSVESPERVEVHPATGAVYVLGGKLVNQFKKFNSWQDAQPVAEVDLPYFKHERYTAVMTLDASADPPVLWIGSPKGYWAHFSLLRIEDRGDAFGEAVDVGKQTKQPSVGTVNELSLHAGRQWLHTSSGRSVMSVFGGRSGAILPLEVPKLGGSGNIAAIGRDGNFYLYHDYPNASVRRFTTEMEPLPFAMPIENLGSPRVRGRGLTADYQGNVYVLWQKPEEEQSPGDAGDANALAVYGPDGKLKHRKLIDSQIRSLSSVRVDRAGNIYLALGVRPPGKKVPDAFAAVDRGKPWRYGTNSNEFDWYTLMYGTIVKFGPEGGEIRADIGGSAADFGYDNKVEIKGAKWTFFGASTVPSWRTKGTPDVCLCESPRFDVDGFGRSFFPDACRFRVGVIDTAGNEICWFGSYGNQDSAGRESAIPTPDIPLYWPQAVAVGDDAVYIGDRLNRRVVRVNLAYRTEATCLVGP
ncbi:MAG: SMP-30/gluconolactonase/LRE family protein [Planctomycetes bacterium]|nr:SMP-30/gluconolactonase/LRE family protein [Planctomycetota bacterium]MBL7038699.1 SMP-30/gluconolactonase/LRE family protein [Pirellulaceae bacterium]